MAATQDKLPQALSWSAFFGPQEKIITSRGHADNDRKEPTMKPKPMDERTITLEPEEYNALMSGLLASEVERESSSVSPEIEAKFKRLEFCMMILVGLVLAVFILCKGDQGQNLSPSALPIKVANSLPLNSSGLGNQ
jgi:hypothetical protein